MDNKKLQDYRDDSKIAKDEFPYWCEKWCVSKETLQEAIDATGSHAVSKISEYLKDNGYISEEN
jgi:hypothetical protein